jgi:ABC-type lipoprotein release transport system permease subunit
MKRSAFLRPFFTFLLLAVFAFSMIGVFTSYFSFLHRQSFQEEVKHHRKDELKSFSFSENDFKKIKWEEVNKEFEYHGKMYDVASIQFENDVYTVYCQSDLIDDMLIGFLKSSGQKSKSKTPQLQLSQPVASLELKSFPKISTSTISFYAESIPSVSIEGVSPPPRIL